MLGAAVAAQAYLGRSSASVNITVLQLCAHVHMRQEVEAVCGYCVILCSISVSESLNAYFDQRGKKDDVF